MVVSPRSQSEKTVHYLRPHELLLRLDTLFAKTMRRAVRCLRAQGKGGKTEKLFAKTMRRAVRCLRVQEKGGKTEKLFARTMARALRCLRVQEMAGMAEKLFARTIAEAVRCLRVQEKGGKAGKPFAKTMREAVRCLRVQMRAGFFATLRMTGRALGMTVTQNDREGARNANRARIKRPRTTWVTPDRPRIPIIINLCGISVGEC